MRIYWVVPMASEEPGDGFIPRWPFENESDILTFEVIKAGRAKVKVSYNGDRFIQCKNLDKFKRMFPVQGRQDEIEALIDEMYWRVEILAKQIAESNKRAG